MGLLWRKRGKKVGELTKDAKASLIDLLQLGTLTIDQWYLRLSVAGKAHAWELLATDSTENDNTIRQRIALSEKPVTDLVLAFVGNVNHRGEKRLMAHMQYFRASHETGLIFGCHLSADSDNKKLSTKGAFIVFGACKQIWI